MPGSKIEYHIPSGGKALGAGFLEKPADFCSLKQHLFRQMNTRDPLSDSPKIEIGFKLGFGSSPHFQVPGMDGLAEQKARSEDIVRMLLS